MKLRVKNKWNDKNKERTPEETGSVLSFNFWKIASANVMHMENEGFQTDTHFQRLDVIAEFTIFLVHVVDASSPDVYDHYSTTLEVLKELGAEEKRIAAAHAELVCYHLAGGLSKL